MCFDGVARVSRAAAQLAFFVAVALDVYQGKAIWNVYIDSLFLNALPVPMLATGFCFIGFSFVFSKFFGPRGVSRWTPNMDLSWTSFWEATWSDFGRVLEASWGVLGASWGCLGASWNVLERPGASWGRLGAV